MGKEGEKRKQNPENKFGLVVTTAILSIPCELLQKLVYHCPRQSYFGVFLRQLKASEHSSAEVKYVR